MLTGLHFLPGFEKGNTAEKPAVVKQLDKGQGNKKVKENFFPVKWWHSGEGKAPAASVNNPGAKAFHSPWINTFFFREGDKRLVFPFFLYFQPPVAGN